MNALSNFLLFSRTHRPCFYLGLASIVGISLGRFGRLDWPQWSLLCGACLITALLVRRWTSFLLITSVVLVSALYYQSTFLFPPDHIAFISYKDRMDATHVKGMVDNDVRNKFTSFGRKQVFELKLNAIKVKGSWRSSSGKIVVDFFPPVHLQYGQEVVLEARLHKAFSSEESRFSYQQYLEDHGMFWIATVGKHKGVEVLDERGSLWIKTAYRIKHKLESVLKRYLEPRECGMIQAMVLGDRSTLPKDIYALFSKTGTAHILAISGMNMAIIAAIVLFLLKVIRCRRSLQFILTIGFLFIYAFLSGWTASVVRSVVMAAVILSSFCLEEETDTLNSLGLAAIVLLAMNPLNLFDIGFQLSFFSVGIIATLCPLAYRLVVIPSKNKIIVRGIQVLGFSLIAWLGVSGLTAYYFQMLTPIGVIANIVIVPLADLVVALGLGVSVLGLFFPWLAFIFAGSLKAVFNLMLVLTLLFSQVPFGSFRIAQLSLWCVVFYYMLVLMAAFFVRRKLFLTASIKNYKER